MRIDPAEYRKRADECRRQSERSIDKAQWLRIAEAWMVLSQAEGPSPTNVGAETALAAPQQQRA